MSRRVLVGSILAVAIVAGHMVFGVEHRTFDARGYHEDSARAGSSAGRNTPLFGVTWSPGSGGEACRRVNGIVGPNPEVPGIDCTESHNLTLRVTDGFQTPVPANGDLGMTKADAIAARTVFPTD